MKHDLAAQQHIKSIILTLAALTLLLGFVIIAEFILPTTFATNYPAYEAGTLAVKDAFNVHFTSRKSMIEKASSRVRGDALFTEDDGGRAFAIIGDEATAAGMRNVALYDTNGTLVRARATNRYVTENIYNKPFFAHLDTYGANFFRAVVDPEEEQMKYVRSVTGSNARLLGYVVYSEELTDATIKSVFEKNNGKKVLDLNPKVLYYIPEGIVLVAAEGTLPVLDEIEKAFRDNLLKESPFSFIVQEHCHLANLALGESAHVKEVVIPKRFQEAAKRYEKANGKTLRFTSHGKQLGLVFAKSTLYPEVTVACLVRNRGGFGTIVKYGIFALLIALLLFSLYIVYLTKLALASDGEDAKSQEVPNENVLSVSNAGIPRNNERDDAFAHATNDEETGDTVDLIAVMETAPNDALSEGSRAGEKEGFMEEQHEQQQNAPLPHESASEAGSPKRENDEATLSDIMEEGDVYIIDGNEIESEENDYFSSVEAFGVMNLDKDFLGLTDALLSRQEDVPPHKQDDERVTEGAAIISEEDTTPPAESAPLATLEEEPVATASSSADNTDRAEATPAKAESIAGIPPSKEEAPKEEEEAAPAPQEGVIDVPLEELFSEPIPWDQERERIPFEDDYPIEIQEKDMENFAEILYYEEIIVDEELLEEIDEDDDDDEDDEDDEPHSAEREERETLEEELDEVPHIPEEYYDKEPLAKNKSLTELIDSVTEEEDDSETRWRTLIHTIAGTLFIKEDFPSMLTKIENTCGVRVKKALFAEYFSSEQAFKPNGYVNMSEDTRLNFEITLDEKIYDKILSKKKVLYIKSHPFQYKSFAKTISDEDKSGIKRMLFIPVFDGHEGIEAFFIIFSVSAR